ncbi:hypothetical protein NDU88_005553 [Pleurodeles waltl]|uniref:Uncharacterized protein n=1 Tax=Pleurodeles waltl TaxID=8319 RepID=A0AAV7LUE8_PLEWA|nr:hypothetical protein NDU88_005553 [Pleurodeles waltl]
MVIHGTCIAKQLGILKTLQGRFTQLERNIHTLKLEYFCSKSTATVGAIYDKLTVFSEEAIQETNYIDHDAQARWYGEGDRPALAAIGVSCVPGAAPARGTAGTFLGMLTSAPRTQRLIGIPGTAMLTHSTSGSSEPCEEGPHQGRSELRERAEAEGGA